MKRRGGFSLVEMLMVLCVMSVVTVVLGRLFMSTLRTYRASEVAQAQTVAVDRMIAQLRKDVWNGSQMNVIGEQEVGIFPPAGGLINWRYEKELDGFRRTLIGPDNALVSRDLYARGVRSLVFVAEGDDLVVTMGRSEQTPGDTIRLVSQLQLLKEEQP